MNPAGQEYSRIATQVPVSRKLEIHMDGYGLNQAESLTVEQLIVVHARSTLRP